MIEKYEYFIESDSDKVLTDKLNELIDHQNKMEEAIRFLADGIEDGSWQGVGNEIDSILALNKK